MTADHNREARSEHGVFSVPRPLVKWVGGKGQIADTLSALAPPQFGHYFEPFFGGGALFFRLLAAGRVHGAYIGDLNPHLYRLYVAVVEDVEAVISLLRSPLFENSEENYYRVRAWDRHTGWSQVMANRGLWPLVAARTIFLSKLAFNGLWRENRRGQHNAPYCKCPDKDIVDEVNLRAVSRALNALRRALVIAQAPYDWLDPHAAQLAYQYLGWNFTTVCPGDLCYLDPPYVKWFTGYSAQRWDLHALYGLREAIRRLTDVGAYVMLSQNDLPVTRELFEGLRMIPLKSHCRINRDGTRRRNAMSELVILNYDEEGQILQYESTLMRSEMETMVESLAMVEEG